jgi:Flp pilus assembly pilin Flp
MVPISNTTRNGHGAGRQPASRWRTVVRLAREEAGAAAVEFALVATAFFMMLIAVFEYSYVLFIGASLESAVLTASRYGITGSTEEGVTREDIIRDIILERTLNLLPVEDMTITTKVYQRFDQIGQAEPFTDSNNNGVRDEGEAFTDVNGNGVWDDDMGLAGLGGPGDIVLYTVEYTAGALTDLFTPILGQIQHRAAVAVRNEPFGS